MTKAGAGLTLVELEPSADFAGAYTHVGQYVQVAEGSSRSYFALCGDPGAASWSLLVRAKGVVAEALAVGKGGATFSVSEPLGSGFDWEKTLDADVFVVVAGTGFAIAPPILRARVREGEGAATSLLIGTDGPVALEAFLSDLVSRGVQVTLCAPTAAQDADATSPFPLVHDDLVETLALRIAALRPRRPSRAPAQTPRAVQQRRRVCVFAAGPEALLKALQDLLARENELAGFSWCELLLNA